MCVVLDVSAGEGHQKARPSASSFNDKCGHGECSSICGLCSFNQGRPRMIEKDGEGLR